MNEYLTNLQKVIKKLHGCDSIHQDKAHVIELFGNEKVWEGDVEIFDLIDHDKAEEAYAWGYDKNGSIEYIVVLKVDPIRDPSDAVKAAIASGMF